MRDSRLGTYGALGLILSLALRISAIGAIGHPVDVPLALIAAAALSRAAMPVAMWLLPQARTEGLAASAGRPGRGRVLLGAGLGVIVSFLCLPVMVAGVAIAASVAVGALSLGIAKRQIDGVTGDVLGGMQQLVAITCLATL